MLNRNKKLHKYFWLYEQRPHPDPMKFDEVFPIEEEDASTAFFGTRENGTLTHDGDDDDDDDDGPVDEKG